MSEFCKQTKGMRKYVTSSKVTKIKSRN